MIIEIGKNGLPILMPSPGNVLTNGEAYSTLVYLGAHDSASNWREIPEGEVPDPDAEPVDEVDAFLTEMEAAL